MNILLTNDDGIEAPGIRALASSIPKGINIVVAAPANERSASSHSISLGQKLRVEETVINKVRYFAVHGTPADCVKFALAAVKGFVPDLIVSGINQGANTGVSVYYSGTISAAREGFINRVPSVAISLCSSAFKDFTASKDIARRLIEGYQEKRFSCDVMLNVNVPPVPAEKIKGVRITKQAASRFIEEFIPEKEHEGKKVYDLTGEIEVYDPDGTSDEEAIAEGFISVTPLKLDLTDYQAMGAFKPWAEQLKFQPSEISPKNENSK